MMNNLESLLDEAFDDLLLSKKSTQDTKTKKQPEVEEGSSTIEATPPTVDWKEMLANLTDQNIKLNDFSDCHSTFGLEKLGEFANHLKGFENLNDFGDLFSSHQGDGAEENDAFIESFVTELLSQDVLYEPLKDLYEKYPNYLEKNRFILDAEKFKQYEAQAGYLKQLITLWDKGEAPEGKKWKHEKELFLEVSASLDGKSPSLESFNEGLTSSESSTKNRDLAWCLLQRIEACGQPPEEILPAEHRSFF